MEKQMKTIIAAATLTLIAPMAIADEAAWDVTPRGYLEISTETQDVQFNAGVDATYADLTFSADYYADKLDGGSFSFTEVELGASYALNEMASIYAVAGYDNDFNYQDTTIGLAVSF